VKVSIVIKNQFSHLHLRYANVRRFA